MNPVTVGAFCDELEKIGLSKVLMRALRTHNADFAGARGTEALRKLMGATDRSNFSNFSHAVTPTPVETSIPTALARSERVDRAEAARLANRKLEYLSPLSPRPAAESVPARPRAADRMPVGSIAPGGTKIGPPRSLQQALPQSPPPLPTQRPPPLPARTPPLPAQGLPQRPPPLPQMPRTPVPAAA
jgi:hypothetical protein